MEERFDLSWGNKEVQMWAYIMIPLILAGLLWVVFSDSSAYSCFWLAYLRNLALFFQKKSKALEKELPFSNALLIG